MFLKKTGRDCSRCPACIEGRLVLKESIPPSRYRAPPASVSIEIPIASVQ